MNRKKEPLISVIMSVYNETLKELHDSIHSILSQTYKNIEFIIIDDNPKSLSIRRYLGFERKNKNFKLLINKRNLGPAGARNVGIKHSHGIYVAIIDADDIANRNRLVSQLRFLIQNDVDFVFPNYQLMSSNGHIFKGAAINLPSITNQRDIYYIFSHISDISMNSGWFVKKSVFNKLQGYRHVISEDYDFIARAIVSRYRLGYQSDVLMYKRYRQNSIMRTHSLGIYLITKYIQYYLKKKKNCIFSINKFNTYINNHVTDKIIKKFNNFIIIGHKVKYNHGLWNSILLIYYLCTTKYAIGYIINKIIVNIRMKRFISRN